MLPVIVRMYFFNSAFILVLCDLVLLFDDDFLKRAVTLHGIAFT